MPRSWRQEEGLVLFGECVTLRRICTNVTIHSILYLWQNPLGELFWPCRSGMSARTGLTHQRIWLRAYPNPTSFLSRWFFLLSNSTNYSTKRFRNKLGACPGISYVFSLVSFLFSAEWVVYKSGTTLTPIYIMCDLLYFNIFLCQTDKITYKRKKNQLNYIYNILYQICNQRKKYH